MKKQIVTDKNEVKRMIAEALREAGCTNAGIAGVLGNIEAESAYQSKNLQNSYEKKLGLSDMEYVDAVDCGAYGNFAKDSAGFGLAQWTYWSRKQNLLNYCRSKSASIADTETQIEFLVSELKGYRAVWQVLVSTDSVFEAASVVLKQYEKPADQSAAACQRRAAISESAIKSLDLNSSKPDVDTTDWKKKYEDLVDTLRLIVNNT